jgi:hypothetical protein
MSKVFQTKNQIFMKEGDQITHAIFVKTGELILESLISMDKTNIWPSASNIWEINKNQSHVRHKVQEFKPF